MAPAKVAPRDIRMAIGRDLVRQIGRSRRISSFLKPKLMLEDRQYSNYDRHCEAASADNFRRSIVTYLIFPVIKTKDQ